MKPFPYILSVIILGFGGIAGRSDHSSHSIKIVVCHIDKFNIQDKSIYKSRRSGNGLQQVRGKRNTSALSWDSTRRGKKITVKAELFNGFIHDPVHVIKCNGGTVAENRVQTGSDRDLIVNLGRSGECVLNIESPKISINTGKEVIMYTIVDTY